jgi:hypothetical protein
LGNISAIRPRVAGEKLYQPQAEWDNSPKDGLMGLGLVISLGRGFGKKYPIVRFISGFRIAYNERLGKAAVIHGEL